MRKASSQSPLLAPLLLCCLVTLRVFARWLNGSIEFDAVVAASWFSGLWNLDNKFLATTCGKHNYKLPNDSHNSYKQQSQEGTEGSLGNADSLMACSLSSPYFRLGHSPPSPLRAHNEAINLKAANKKINKSRRFVCLSVFHFVYVASGFKNNFIPCCLSCCACCLSLLLLLYSACYCCCCDPLGMRI